MGLAVGGRSQSAPSPRSPAWSAVRLRWRDVRRIQARSTHACLRRARGELGYAPAFELEEGLSRQAAAAVAPLLPAP